MNCPHVLGRLSRGGCPVCSGEVLRSPPILVTTSPGSAVALADQRPHTFASATACSDPDDLPLEAQAELLRELDADACRESLSEFIREAFRVVQPGVDLEWGPHLQAICDHVQWQLEDRAYVARDPSKLRRLKCQNLLINVPPRSLKTVCLTLATVWAWLRWPTLKIMYLSANPRVASNSARMARDLIRSPWFRDTFRTRWGAEELDNEGNPVDAAAIGWAPDLSEEAWEIRRDQDALSDLGNTAGGVRVSRGLSSTLTGEGADVIYVDDPHDVRDGATKVAKAVEDYDSAVHNRLNDQRTGIRCCIMQRVRKTDFSARWIEIVKSLVHVRLPLEYESPERAECACGTCTQRNVFGFIDWRTREGAVLHPRFTPDFIAGEKTRLGSRAAGQLQQRPIEAGGQIFKVGWWSWYSLTTAAPAARPTGARLDPPFVLGRRRDGSLDLDWVDLSIDATGGSTSDTASSLGMGAIGGKSERRFLLRDFTPGPATWLQTLAYVLDAIRGTIRITGRQPRLTVLVEKKALGQALVEQLRKAIADGDIRYPDGTAVKARIETYEPTGKGSKEDRAELMEPDLATGLFHLLDGDDANTAPYRDEIEGFPRVDRDDRVDYTSQCLDHRRNAQPEWAVLFRKRREALLEAQRASVSTSLT